MFTAFFAAFTVYNVIIVVGILFVTALAFAAGTAIGYFDN